MYRYDTETAPITHADHNWEEWHAYLDSNLPDDIDPNSTGICCHDCQTVAVDKPFPFA